jgi:hypothetical protein
MENSADRRRCTIGGGLGASAVRVQQQAAVAAAHHREPEADEARGLIAELVGDPVPLRDCAVAV